MKKAGIALASFALVGLAASGLFSCLSVDSLTASGFDPKAAAAISKTASAASDLAPDIAKALQEIPPEQEYYIGRAVGSTVFEIYPAYDRKALNDYLNQLGQSLALFSERPAIYEGYHFIALDSKEINAFATPSGLVMASRGLISLTASEDELAAILAHEIAHITCQHGLNTIKNARFSSAVTKTATTAVKDWSASDYQELTGALSDTVGDIATSMIKNGYSKGAELEADKKAVAILKAAGYDPGALKRVLATMDSKLDPKAKDFSKTHPKPKDRIKALDMNADAKASAPPANKARQERYTRAMKAI
jgi:beta-barrel assembly-enhancing protease